MLVNHILYIVLNNWKQNGYTHLNKFGSRATPNPASNVHQIYILKSLFDTLISHQLGPDIIRYPEDFSISSAVHTRYWEISVLNIVFRKLTMSEDEKLHSSYHL